MPELSPNDGHQALDRANGIRVGAVVGALLGAAVVAATGVLNVGIVVVGAAAGAYTGYRREQRRQP